MLKYFIPHLEGLKEDTYYVVEVSFNPGNAIGKAILAVTHLDEHTNLPNKAFIFNINYIKEIVPYTEAYYIKVIREINIKVPNKNKQVKDIQNIFELEQHNIQRKKQ